MYNVTLSKVAGGTQVRTDIVQGICLNYPNIGEPFVMTSESLSFVGGIRQIVTSIVQEIAVQDECLIVSTQNSTYQLIIT